MNWIYWKLKRDIELTYDKWLESIPKDEIEMMEDDNPEWDEHGYYIPKRYREDD